MRNFRECVFPDVGWIEARRRGRLAPPRQTSGVCQLRRTMRSASRPPPASRASGARAINETGPPVSGRTEEAEAVAVALAEAVGLALAVGEAVGLAVGVAEGLAVGEAVEPPSE